MKIVCAKPAFSKAQGILSKLLPIIQFHIARIVVKEELFPPSTWIVLFWNGKIIIYLNKKVVFNEPWYFRGRHLLHFGDHRDFYSSSLSLYFSSLLWETSLFTFRVRFTVIFVATNSQLDRFYMSKNYLFSGKQIWRNNSLDVVRFLRRWFTETASAYWPIVFIPIFSCWPMTSIHSTVWKMSRKKIVGLDSRITVSAVWKILICINVYR